VPGLNRPDFAANPQFRNLVRDLLRGRSMFQVVESSLHEVPSPFVRSGHVNAVEAVLPAEPAKRVDALLRGSLEILSIRRIENACRVRVRILPRRGRALSRKEREVFERLVGGSCQKEIAYDIGVALTTVSAHVRFSLHKLGLENWEAAVLAVAALEHGKVVPGSGTREGDHAVEELEVLLSERELARLTDAERTVALFALDGCTNAEIANIRRCSPRTVANQVASAFRKLGVRCRLELIRCLASLPRVPEVGRVASAVLTIGEVTRAHAELGAVAVAK
jgi:DNA-binding NarL/FixJ family response regulator